jgi:hypothetical protein
MRLPTAEVRGELKLESSNTQRILSALARRAGDPPSSVTLSGAGWLDGCVFAVESPDQIQIAGCMQLAMINARLESAAGVVAEGRLEIDVFLSLPEVGTIPIFGHLFDEGHVNRFTEEQIHAAGTGANNWVLEYSPRSRMLGCSLRGDSRWVVGRLKSLQSKLERLLPEVIEPRIRAYSGCENDLRPLQEAFRVNLPVQIPENTSACIDLAIPLQAYDLKDLTYLYGDTKSQCLAYYCAVASRGLPASGYPWGCSCDRDGYVYLRDTCYRSFRDRALKFAEWLHLDWNNLLPEAPPRER